MGGHLVLAHVLLHRRRRPSLVTGQLSPVVVILQRSPDVHHVVDCAGTTQDLSPWHMVDSAIVRGLRRGVQTPVILWVLECLEKARGRVDGRIVDAVFACFDNSDGDVGVFAEASCDGASSCPAAADDEVKGGLGELLDGGRGGGLAVAIKSSHVGDAASAMNERGNWFEEIGSAKFGPAKQRWWSYSC